MANQKHNYVDFLKILAGRSNEMWKKWCGEPTLQVLQVLVHFAELGYHRFGSGHDCSRHCCICLHCVPTSQLNQLLKYTVKCVCIKLNSSICQFQNHTFLYYIHACTILEGTNTSHVFLIMWHYNNSYMIVCTNV